MGGYRIEDDDKIKITFVIIVMLAINKVVSSPDGKMFTSLPVNAMHLDSNLKSTIFFPGLLSVMKYTGPVLVSDTSVPIIYTLNIEQETQKVRDIIINFTQTLDVYMTEFKRHHNDSMDLMTDTVSIYKTWGADMILSLNSISNVDEFFTLSGVESSGSKRKRRSMMEKQAKGPLRNQKNENEDEENDSQINDFVNLWDTFGMMNHTNMIDTFLSKEKDHLFDESMRVLTHEKVQCDKLGMIRETDVYDCNGMIKIRHKGFSRLIDDNHSKNVIEEHRRFKRDYKLGGIGGTIGCAPGISAVTDFLMGGCDGSSLKHLQDAVEKLQDTVETILDTQEIILTQLDSLKEQIDADRDYNKKRFNSIQSMLNLVARRTDERFSALEDFLTFFVRINAMALSLSSDVTFYTRSLMTNMESLRRMSFSRLGEKISANDIPKSVIKRVVKVLRPICLQNTNMCPAFTDETELYAQSMVRNAEVVFNTTHIMLRFYFPVGHEVGWYYMYKPKTICLNYESGCKCTLDDVIDKALLVKYDHVNRKLDSVFININNLGTCHKNAGELLVCDQSILDSIQTAPMYINSLPYNATDTESKVGMFYRVKTIDKCSSSDLTNVGGRNWLAQSSASYELFNSTNGAKIEGNDLITGTMITMPCSMFIKTAKGIYAASSECQKWTSALHVVEIGINLNENLVVKQWKNVNLTDNQQNRNSILKSVQEQAELMANVTELYENTTIGRSLEFTIRQQNARSNIEKARDLLEQSRESLAKSRALDYQDQNSWLLMGLIILTMAWCGALTYVTCKGAEAQMFGGMMGMSQPNTSQNYNVEDLNDELSQIKGSTDDNQMFESEKKEIDSQHHDEMIDNMKGMTTEQATDYMSRRNGTKGYMQNSGNELSCVNVIAFIVILIACFATFTDGTTVQKKDCKLVFSGMNDTNFINGLQVVQLMWCEFNGYIIGSICLFAILILVSLVVSCCALATSYSYNCGTSCNASIFLLVTLMIAYSNCSECCDFFTISTTDKVDRMLTFNLSGTDEIIQILNIMKDSDKFNLKIIIGLSIYACGFTMLMLMLFIFEIASTTKVVSKWCKGLPITRNEIRSCFFFGFVDSKFILQIMRGTTVGTDDDKLNDGQNKTCLYNTKPVMSVMPDAKVKTLRMSRSVKSNIYESSICVDDEDWPSDEFDECDEEGYLSNVDFKNGKGELEKSYVNSLRRSKSMSKACRRRQEFIDDVHFNVGTDVKEDCVNVRSKVASGVVSENLIDYLIDPKSAACSIPKDQLMAEAVSMDRDSDIGCAGDSIEMQYVTRKMQEFSNQLCAMGSKLLSTFELKWHFPGQYLQNSIIEHYDKCEDGSTHWADDASMMNGKCCRHTYGSGLDLYGTCFAIFTECCVYGTPLISRNPWDTKEEKTPKEIEEKIKVEFMFLMKAVSDSHDTLVERKYLPNGEHECAHLRLISEFFDGIFNEKREDVHQDLFRKLTLGAVQRSRTDTGFDAENANKDYIRKYNDIHSPGFPIWLHDATAIKNRHADEENMCPFLSDHTEEYITRYKRCLTRLTVDGYTCHNPLVTSMFKPPLKEMEGNEFHDTSVRRKRGEMLTRLNQESDEQGKSTKIGGTSFPGEIHTDEQKKALKDSLVRDNKLRMNPDVTDDDPQTYQDERGNTIVNFLEKDERKPIVKSSDTQIPLIDKKPRKSSMKQPKIKQTKPKSKGENIVLNSYQMYEKEMEQKNETSNASEAEMTRRMRSKYYNELNEKADRQMMEEMKDMNCNENDDKPSITREKAVRLCHKKPISEYDDHVYRKPMKRGQRSNFDDESHYDAKMNFNDEYTDDEYSCDVDRIGKHVMNNAKNSSFLNFILISVITMFLISCFVPCVNGQLWKSQYDTNLVPHFQMNISGCADTYVQIVVNNNSTKIDSCFKNIDFTTSITRVDKLNQPGSSGCSASSLTSKNGVCIGCGDLVKHDWKVGALTSCVNTISGKFKSNDEYITDKVNDAIDVLIKTMENLDKVQTKFVTIGNNLKDCINYYMKDAEKDKQSPEYKVIHTYDVPCSKYSFIPEFINGMVYEYDDIINCRNTWSNDIDFACKNMSTNPGFHRTIPTISCGIYGYGIKRMICHTSTSFIVRWKVSGAFAGIGTFTPGIHEIDGKYCFYTLDENLPVGCGSSTTTRKLKSLPDLLDEPSRRKRETTNVNGGDANSANNGGGVSDSSMLLNNLTDCFNTTVNCTTISQPSMSCNTCPGNIKSTSFIIGCPTSASYSHKGFVNNFMIYLISLFIIFRHAAGDLFYMPSATNCSTAMNTDAWTSIKESMILTSIVQLVTVITMIAGIKIKMRNDNKVRVRQSYAMGRMKQEIHHLRSNEAMKCVGEETCQTIVTVFVLYYVQMTMSMLTIGSAVIFTIWQYFSKHRCFVKKEETTKGDKDHSIELYGISNASMNNNKNNKLFPTLLLLLMISMNMAMNVTQKTTTVLSKDKDNKISELTLILGLTIPIFIILVGVIVFYVICTSERFTPPPQSYCIQFSEGFRGKCCNWTDWNGPQVRSYFAIDCKMTREGEWGNKVDSFNKYIVIGKSDREPDSIVTSSVSPPSFVMNVYEGRITIEQTDNNGSNEITGVQMGILPVTIATSDLKKKWNIAANARLHFSIINTVIMNNRGHVANHPSDVNINIVDRSQDMKQGNKKERKAKKSEIILSTIQKDIKSMASANDVNVEIPTSVDYYKKFISTSKLCEMRDSEKAMMQSICSIDPKFNNPSSSMYQMCAATIMNHSRPDGKRYSSSEPWENILPGDFIQKCENNQKSVSKTNQIGEMSTVVNNSKSGFMWVILLLTFFIVSVMCATTRAPTIINVIAKPDTSKDDKVDQLTIIIAVVIPLFIILIGCLIAYTLLNSERFSPPPNSYCIQFENDCKGKICNWLYWRGPMVKSYIAIECQMSKDGTWGNGHSKFNRLIIIAKSDKEISSLIQIAQNTPRFKLMVYEERVVVEIINGQDAFTEIPMASLGLIPASIDRPALKKAWGMSPNSKVHFIAINVIAVDSSGRTDNHPSDVTLQIMKKGDDPNDMSRKQRGKAENKAQLDSIQQSVIELKNMNSPDYNDDKPKSKIINYYDELMAKGTLPEAWSSEKKFMLSIAQLNNVYHKSTSSAYKMCMATLMNHSRETGVNYSSTHGWEELAPGDLMDECERNQKSIGSTAQTNEINTMSNSKFETGGMLTSLIIYLILHSFKLEFVCCIMRHGLAVWMSNLYPITKITICKWIGQIDCNNDAKLTRTQTGAVFPNLIVEVPCDYMKRHELNHIKHTELHLGFVITGLIANLFFESIGTILLILMICKFIEIQCCEMTYTNVALMFVSRVKSLDVKWLMDSHINHIGGQLYDNCTCITDTCSMVDTKIIKRRGQWSAYNGISGKRGIKKFGFMDEIATKMHPTCLLRCAQMSVSSTCCGEPFDCKMQTTRKQCIKEPWMTINKTMCDSCNQEMLTMMNFVSYKSTDHNYLKLAKIGSVCEFMSSIKLDQKKSKMISH